MGTPTFVYVLILLTIAHNNHGQATGLNREHIATYGTEDTCQLARRSWQYYDEGGSKYFCQKEMLK
jgi:hypothetical protein